MSYTTKSHLAPRGTSFNEAALEAAILELFAAQGYEVAHGDTLDRLATDLLLRDDLAAFLRSRYAPNGITEDEVAEIIAEIELVSSGSDYISNKAVIEKISNGFTYQRKDRKMKDFWVEFIDYETPELNSFKIINQFEVQGAELRIPDAVVFINGIPLVVLEFKSATREEATLFNAYEQIAIRYRRGIPELLKYNAFCVLSDGANTKMGSHFAPYEYFYGWRRVGELSETLHRNSGVAEPSGIAALETMVAGLFNKKRFVDVIRNFIYFPDKSDTERKVVPRYPQYYAARALHKNILAHRKPDGDGKGGVYFGATGCGKSIAMLYLARLLLRDAQLKTPTLLFISDRTDLDTQLAELFEPSKTFLGENSIRQFDSRADLRDALSGIAAGGVFLTTVQKFSEDTDLLSERANIICISDEAHRSQLNMQQKVEITATGVRRSYGFAHHLRSSLPNATYVGFSGTPIDETMQVFGEIVDRYTMTDSVADGITVKLTYDGRAARVTTSSTIVDQIERYYAECAKAGANESQINESKVEMTRLDQILGAPERLRKVAADFVAYWDTRITEDATIAGKTLFVCANRPIAYALYQAIGEIRPEWLTQPRCSVSSSSSSSRPPANQATPLLQLVMTRGRDDAPALYNLLGDDVFRREQARQFKDPQSSFKIALIVDMWLTGFDVPELDLICIDKPIQKHGLIQAISRVNRKCANKVEGIVVDYIGIKKHLDEALSIYTGGGDGSGGFDGIDTAIELVRTQLEILKALLHPFDYADFFGADKTPLQQLRCLQRAVEKVQCAKSVEERFMRHSKTLKDAWSLCCGADVFSQEEVVYLQFFIAVRSILYKLTQGTAPDAAEMNRRVKKLLEQALQSDEVQILFQDDRDAEKSGINLFDEAYLAKILALDYPNTKIRLLQKLLKQALRKLSRVNKAKAVEFTKRLDNIVKHYNDREADQAAVKRVLGDLTDELAKLIHDVQAEQASNESLGISYEEKAFYDILKAVSIKHNFAYAEDKFLLLAKAIKAMVEEKSKYAHFLRRADIKAQLERDLIMLLAANGYPPDYNEEVFQEIFDQTANFKKHIAEDTI